ncbi:MAG TPA: metallophosphoesterase [Candidatus Limnocylindrales bacterium]|nr:metallophosphoesterase [Candidatus Limnocylindrales bacterium]
MQTGSPVLKLLTTAAVAILVLSVAPAAIGVEAAAPPSAKPPEVQLLAPGALTAVAVPLNISWPAATPAGSPIYRYQLQRSAEGGAWLSVGLPSRLSTNVTLKLPPWQVHSFRVRAIAANGQASEWAMGAPAWLSALQESDESVELSSGWQSVVDSKSFGGARATASGAGASAELTFVGREIGWVAVRGPAKGQASVYLDGALAATVNLQKSSVAKKRLVFRHEWSTVAEHTIEIVTLGSTVDLDAFVVLTDATPETLVGAGDIASCADNDDEGTADVVAGVDGIVFTAGDNVYPNGSAANFANCYDPSWGAFKDRTRPVPGNHEYFNVPGATGYFDYFGESAGPAGRGWYRYAAGTWRIYALTSECTQTSQCALDQLEWLAADLAAAPHRCVAAIWHRPRWSTGEHGDSMRMAAAMELLYDHGAEIVLTGHDHSYQRYAPASPDGVADPVGGIRQWVVATGGASLYDFESDDPLTDVRDNTSHGVLRLDLGLGSYSWEFMASAGDTFTDSGTSSCH